MKHRIPLAKPEILQQDRDAVLEVLSTSQLSMGTRLAEFEEAICACTGSKFAVAVNSGTSALHLCLRMLALPENSEVVLPSFAFAAPLNVLLQEKLRPVFAEIDPVTLNVTAETIAAALTPRTKAIIAVHTFGRPLDMHGIRKLAEERKVPVIEDACEALGATVYNQMTGTFGEVGALAFYPNKQITTGEGGIFLTSNTQLAEKGRRLRNQGRDPSLGVLQHVEAGYSYRLSDINCALGISQLRRLEDTLQRRQAIARLYDEKLAGIPLIVRPPLTSPQGRISWFAYVVQLAPPLGADCRDWICTAMERHGIGTGKYFAPLHLQPVLKNTNRPLLPITEEVAQRVIALPFFNQITDAEVEEVCVALSSSLAQFTAGFSRRKQ